MRLKQQATIPDTQWEQSSGCVYRCWQFQTLPTMYSLKDQTPWIFPEGESFTMNLKVNETLSSMFEMLTQRARERYMVSLPLCGVHCRPSGYPGLGFGGQGRGGRKAPHHQSATSEGRSPAESAHSLASASSHPRGWPWSRCLLLHRNNDIKVFHLQDVSGSAFIVESDCRLIYFT